ncbi:hypothetical protein [Glutamicibacter nicotianae]|uniref:hypothetical protein n=1 Tax=Glutamicibacter nicotianae TaxID=37929 RepID=UPI0019597762|nr:hypothetical protein [Glutamicibacter nicotianae]MBM7766704.1 hypothetical protein [Glutamicibacter nicotianae]
MQRKDIGKRLADGISAKLEFDYICERGRSFNEYHLHGVMNEIISALISSVDFLSRPGYAHEALARDVDTTAGRKREVDFYIQAHNPSLTDVCIEAKWAGSSHCSWDRVLLDICRLALVNKHSPSTECLFVLSGPTKEVDAVLKSLERNMPRRNMRGRSGSILQRPVESEKTYKNIYRLRDWGGRFAGNEFVQKGLPKKKDGRPNIPVKINTQLVRTSGTRTAKWQTIVWRILNN